MAARSAFDGVVLTFLLTVEEAEPDPSLSTRGDGRLNYALGAYLTSP